MIGYYGGARLLTKISLRNTKSKLIILNGKKLFDKYGGISVFICKLVPLSKLCISLLAGVYKQDYFQFILYSILGILIANSMIIGLGMSLIINLKVLINFFANYKALILILLNASIILFLMRKNRSKKR